jgi:hypothetical protein
VRHQVRAHRDPLGDYRQVVARGRPPAAIIEAARRCRELSVEDATPALLAMASRSDDLFDRAVERWVARYHTELEETPDERELALVRGALSALPGLDTTAAVGADALAQLFELRGMDYARAAVLRFIHQLP